MKKKLIEVALPLEAINVASAREKSIRHGHPSTLHLWWSRKPLATARAVIFASLVDDPLSNPERFPTQKSQEDERRRLFGIIEELVKWENSTNEKVLERARVEIDRSTDGRPPIVLDPFCGGGSIPLEAQRLGLVTHASDLNPVAVLLTKALVDIPPAFAGQPPVSPEGRSGVGASGTWQGSAGLAEDIRRYGSWVRNEASRRIGHLYPQIALPKSEGGALAPITAWLWARTAVCPNPACRAKMVLTSKLGLASKNGTSTWAEPIVDAETRTVRFEVRTRRGIPPSPPKVGRGATFKCLVCGELAPEGHIKAEGMAGRMDIQLMAMVAEGPRGRVYVSPTSEQETAARSVSSTSKPSEALSTNPRHSTPPSYGMSTFGDLFTGRQLVALGTLIDCVAEVRERIRRDTGVLGDRDPDGYAAAVATYLAFAVDKVADRLSMLGRWDPTPTASGIINTFSRQAIPMSWDFAEGAPLGTASGSFLGAVELVAKTVATLGVGPRGLVELADATQIPGSTGRVLVSTDPPYYDNVPYADLADYFYVWLRRALATVYPTYLRTVLSPKAEELVADVVRHGGREAARVHFESGLGEAFKRIQGAADPEFPVTIYYAFKQAESEGGGADAHVASTGWESMLEGLLAAGFAVTGTWPIRSELGNRMRSVGANVLASAIVLVCRPRPIDATMTDRRGFLAALRSELPEALRTLQHGNIAPVDLAQAAIGPGMAVFSRHRKVVEADGTTMTVRTALVQINSVLSEVLSRQEDQFDNDTRWAVTWFDQNGLQEGRFGEAEVLSKAKNTGLNALRAAGIIKDGAGKVRLLKREELDASWDPTSDKRLTVWEVTQHLIRALDEGGEQAAADLVRKVGGLADTARDLAYRLYSICERKKWAEEALGYNALVTAWPEITRLAASTPGSEGPQQTRLFQ